MKKYIIINTFLLLLLTSCASIKVTTIKNNQKLLSDATGYLVEFETQDMSLRTKLENAIVSKFNENDKTALSSISVYPPIREYSEEEVVYESIAQGCNYLLTIKQTDTKSETGFVMIGGVLVPATDMTYTFDMIIQDLEDKEIVLRSTVSATGDELNLVTSQIASRIVREIKNEELKEQ